MKFFFLILLVLSDLGIACACPSSYSNPHGCHEPSNDSSRLIDSLKIIGVKYYKKNNFEQAIIEWKKVYEIDSTNISVEDWIKKAEEMLSSKN